MRDIAELSDIAQAAIRLGYELVKDAQPTQIRNKGDRDIVTEVDLRVERTIRAYLKDATPEIGFFGEEEGRRTDSENDECVWTLDPIDGTSNFAHGVPLCAVSLALVCKLEALVAAIAVPSLELHYSATKGNGAFVNGNQLDRSDTVDLTKSIVSIGDYAVGQNAAEKNRRRIRLTTLLAERVERVRMFGSAAIDLAWVAEGRTDAAVILSNKPWDTAAGVLLAREAGGLVIDGRGAPHTFQSTETIAMCPGLAASLLPLVQESFAVSTV